MHDKGLARQRTPFYQTSGVNAMSTKLRACQTGQNKKTKKKKNNKNKQQQQNV